MTATAPVPATAAAPAGTMRAAVLCAPRTARTSTVAVPEPGPNEVRIRLQGSGVCASSLPLWEGRDWFLYPREAGAPGHEGWGMIDAIGPDVDVEGLSIGQRVAALSYHAHAEYDIAAADAVVPLPPSLDDMPFPGEPLGCAMNILRRSDIDAGHTVAIIGIGFLGALLTRLASARGARVIAISRRPFSLDVARELGGPATETILMHDHHAIIEQVRALTGGVFADRTIECVGQQWPLDLAGELTRERGRLVIAGFHQDGPRQVNMFLWNWRGLDVINAHERDATQYVAGMRAAVDAIAAGVLNPQALYTHCFTLDDLESAFDVAQRRPDGFMKALVLV